MCLAGCSQGSHAHSGPLPRSWPCFPLTGLSNPQLENAAKKRERATSDPRMTEQKQEKKRLKLSKKPKDPDPPEKDFTPYDYSKSDFKAFAGEAGGDVPQGPPDHVPCGEAGGREGRAEP